MSLNCSSLLQQREYWGNVSFATWLFSMNLGILKLVSTLQVRVVSASHDAYINILHNLMFVWVSFDFSYIIKWTVFRLGIQVSLAYMYLSRKFDITCLLLSSHPLFVSPLSSKSSYCWPCLWQNSRGLMGGLGKSVGRGVPVWWRRTSDVYFCRVGCAVFPSLEIRRNRTCKLDVSCTSIYIMWVDNFRYMYTLTGLRSHLFHFSSRYCFECYSRVFLSCITLDMCYLLFGLIKSNSLLSVSKLEFSFIKINYSLSVVIVKFMKARQLIALALLTDKNIHVSLDYSVISYYRWWIKARL